MQTFTRQLGPLPRVRVTVEEIVIDVYGDRWVRFNTSPYFKNADQDDLRYVRHDLADLYGPLTPYRQEA